jgi:hypothetical protein
MDWRKLAETLTSMTEEEVKALLDEERVSHKRPLIAKRLHQRYSILRSARERAAIMLEIAQ